VLPEIMLACLKVAWLNIYIDCQVFTVILTYITYVTLLTSLKATQSKQIGDSRAVQWHCAKRAEAQFWAETLEIIPQY